jgi:hypothetical protein
MKTNAEIAPRIIELFELSHQLKNLADTTPELSSLSENLYNDINALFLAQNFQMIVVEIPPLLEQIRAYTSSISVIDFLKNELNKIAEKLIELQNLIENE